MKTKVQMAMVWLFGLVGASAYAKSTYWVGGHGGNWSVAENWEGGVPASGDRLYITNTMEGVTLALTNDIPGLALSAIQFGEGGPVELRGEKIGLNNYNPWYNYCAVDSYVPMVMESATAQWDLTVTATESYNQYADVEFRNGKSNVIAGKDGPDYGEGKPVNFYGAVICTNGFLTVGAQNFVCTFHGKVVADDVRGSNNGDGKLALNGVQNEIDALKCGYYGNIQVKKEGTLGSDLVLEWLTTSGGTESPTWQERYVYAITADQTIDRVSQSKPFEGAVGSRKYYCRLRQNTSGASSSAKAQNTLVMRGTADETAYVEVMDKLALVWDPVDDYTMTFAGAQNTTYGELSVKRGTFKVAEGANFANVPKLTISGGATYEADSAGVAALPALKTLELADGSVFKLGANVDRDPFSAGQVDAVLRGMSKFVLPAGVTASVKTLIANGARPVNGTYTGVEYGQTGVEEVSWIEGPGRVVVTDNPTDGVYWKSATGGSWNDPGKWYGGAVPDGTKNVFITAEGVSSYEVVVSSETALPQKLVVGGSGAHAQLFVLAAMSGARTWIEVSDNGKISIGENGQIAYAGVDENGNRTVAELAGSPIKISGGGEIAIEGGELSIADMTGYFEVGDGGEKTARLSMTAGKFSYAGKKAYSDTIRLRKNGFLDFKGGTVESNLRSDISTPDELPMAHIRLSGTAAWSYPRNSSYNLLFGDLTTSTVAGHTGCRDFDIWNQCIPLSDFDTSASSCPYGVKVGYNSGSAKLSVSNTFLAERRMGLMLASQSNHYSVWTSGTGHSITGIVEVLSGGVIDINGAGANETGYSAYELQGLMIGYGGMASAYTKFDGAFRGEMTVMSGGSVTNNFGDTGIGVGYGTGCLAVDGGSLVICPKAKDDWRMPWTRTFAIGMFGGTGACEVDNGGSLYAHCDVYVGGVQTNRYPYQGVHLVERNCPVDRHTAKGVLSLGNGSVDLQQNLVVGADGNGTVEMRGSKGDFSISGNLVLSNAVENAGSGSELSFVLDSDGVSPIRVAGDVIVRENARLSVDATAFVPEKSRYPLLKFSRMVGNSFAAIDVKTSPTGEHGTIEVRNNRVDLVFPGLKKGLIMLVR